ncbi:DUF4959 domain-containing protein [Chitinophaga polysaccharea]|uniref:DUF5000 domain-containing lipoprotein n=1 Tax=Chitinophaga TaxID=79328 RepID=UPI001455A325|nr:MULTISPECIES: DUF5000 domain-containing lipoprotein [Chitinophaga]NLR57623.1 DUF4959 domain-containing protein [Chitinophaga polysaccharea]NLU95536.1 DUF4959 domain-containing protein [Chitinophaga sp. Ak27]
MKPYTFLSRYIAAISLLAMSCSKELHTPVNTSGEKPAVISNVTVTNLPGGAKITYSLPENKDILYVKAVYTIRDGKPREIRSSYYNNFLVVDGFGDTATHKISLYVVSRNELSSDEVPATVKPLLPPMLDVRKSLVVKPDFGGVNISFKNETQADLAIVTLSNDSTGIFGAADVHYTKLASGNYSVRGYDATTRKFGFCVRDHWGNLSDTLLVDITPFYEKLLDKANFREVKLPGDVDYGWGLPIPNLWNGTLWHSADKLDGMPMWITFDLGVTARLSRIGLWQRPNEWIYLQNNLRKFEIWGSTNPASDGSWDSWTKLVEHTVIKPSGLPVGQTTQDDKDAAVAGEQMTVPLDAPRVRYIRVKILRTWTDGGYAANIQLMKFWGNDK